MTPSPATPARPAASPPPGAFARAPARPARLQVAFLTGPVSPGSSALSPAQHRFLTLLPRHPEVHYVGTDFPYPAPARESLPVWQPTALWRASLRNAATFLRARSPAFASTHAPAVRALLAQAGHTVFLAGSCGLELLAGLRLPPRLLRRITVLAYGPVARRPFPAVAELRVARGSRDLFARFTRLPPDLLLPCGHLGYLARPEFAAWCTRPISALLPRLPHATAL